MFFYPQEVSASSDEAEFYTDFRPSECDRFLSESGDMNTDYHDSDKRGVLQGAAIFLAFNQIVSMWLPGQGVRNITATFHRPIRVGEREVAFRLRRTDKRNIVCNVYSEDGQLACEFTVETIPLSLIARALPQEFSAAQ